MPWNLDGNCVVKTDTKEVVKCHPTRAKAVAHLRALYANVHETEPPKQPRRRPSAPKMRKELA